MIGAYCLSEPGSGSDALGAKTRADAAGRRQLRAERREDVDHQRRLRRRLHRLRAKCDDGEHFTRVHRRARVRRRDERQGRTQDGPARLVDDAGDPAGRAGAGGEPARRDRQGPQDRVQRPELRALQARARCAAAARGARSARRRATPAQRKQFGQPIAALRRHQAQDRRDDRRARTRSRA